MARIFSLKERDFIVDNYQKMTDKEIANELDRSEVSVSNYRVRILNLRKTTQGGKSYSELERIFFLLDEGKTDKEIIKMVGIAPHRLRYIRKNEKKYRMSLAKSKKKKNNIIRLHENMPDLTLQEIADIMGITHTYVADILTKHYKR